MEADRAPVRGSNTLWEYKSTRVSAAGTLHEADLGKSAMLRVMLPMESLRVLPSDGTPLKTLVDLPAEKISAAGGYRHESSLRRALRRCGHLIKQVSKWGSPNHRELAFQESTRPRGKQKWSGYNMASAAELGSHPELGQHFAHSKTNGGYHERPGFIHHNRFRCRPNEKLVLCALAKEGLFSAGGMLEKTTQGMLSRLTGLHPDTVAAIIYKFGVWSTWATGAVCAWPRDPGAEEPKRVDVRGEYPIIRIVEQPGRQVNGKWTQPPNKYIYLGDRMLDERTGVIETQRLIKLADDKGLRAAIWWTIVAAIHGRLLRQWVGTERHVGTFWGACRMEIESGGHGVPRKDLDYLFPEWRGPT